MELSESTENEQDEAIEAVFQIYKGTGFKPPPKQFTVLAAFFLTISTSHISNVRQPPKVISLSTGTKCMPAIKYSPRGELVHDSHAEVLARRGAARWLLEEIGRISDSREYISEWLTRTDTTPSIDPDQPPRYKLRDGVEVNMYISTLPCGDASMGYLASIQDKTMAALKSINTFPVLAPHQASRGRDNYNRLGVLRTKPGRADSPPALSMSCSDKIAKWSVLGIQGSFGAKFLEPVYISEVVIGEVPLEQELRSVVRTDCERALRGRVKNTKDLPQGYTVHLPRIRFTQSPFVHSKTELDIIVKTTGSCNESLCWVADSKPAEVLINGLKRSTPPRHRYAEKYRPLLSRISVFNLYYRTLNLEGLDLIQPQVTYTGAKTAASSMRYQRAKLALFGAEGPFAGWIKIDEEFQCFTMDGHCLKPTVSFET
ncbi:hypothetical protein Agabi119p4_4502 [Agaricus bisporus var. burnettii]|uniref:A to I editase domain-containing protein n=1 Tax=Agaricus bisporus var. burnettii TaxID=192524 RepID=A0A8H7F3P2_AGABI|nr:hypothetical protein Agabi119p4_4502 [Agaricus bisporus var. burnettii]